MQKREFEVRVARPVIEYATVTVKAESEEVALSAAAAAAAHLPESAWEGSFDSDDYEAHAVGIIGAGEEEPPHRTRYLLLAADLGVAEGDLCLQPWARQEDQLAVADICNDWSECIEELREQGFAEFERRVIPDGLNN